MSVKNNYILADRIPFIISFLTVYMLIAGAAYTLGFWALFPVNIFDFIGVVDIAKSSVPGLMVSVLVIFSVYVHHSFKSEFRKEITPTADNKYADFLINNKNIFVSVFMLMPITLYAFMSYTPSFVIEYSSMFEYLLWAFVLLSCVVVYIYFVSNGYVRRLNNRKYMTGVTIITMIFVPLASFTIGFGQAKNLILGVKYNYVLSTLNAVEVNVSGSDRYLGYYGGKYFTWDPNVGLVKIYADKNMLYVKSFEYKPRK
ncbi:hypothetical protein [Aeromonas dhakensis]|uniref:hypothetical protein n=1 Tax=Aeromonas dhakensis TaxID=196024 RepID=UPI001F61070D|nr:hypothetical protein [Aeromonas dhakensis]UNU87903.1 hypothetical protein GB930_06685 [Aeromonas dhakensis]